MTILAMKCVSALFVFAVAMLGGLLPLVLSKQLKQPASFFSYGEAFAHGIFLAVCFLHLLPESVHQFSVLVPDNHYPVIFLVCLLSIVLIQYLEYQAFSLGQSIKALGSPYTAYVLFASLSVHAVIEGSALGLGNDTAHIGMLLLAILSHKGAATFALAMKLRAAGFHFKTQWALITGFSLMTPLGILLAACIHTVLAQPTAQWLEPVFGGVAAGTFLAVALSPYGFHLRKDPQRSGTTVGQWVSYAFAIAIMALFTHD